MSIDKKKSKGGRPSRANGEKLQRVNLSLRPSVMFGLELLARAQHRSLSQAVEWALQMGMNTYEVGPNSKTLTDLVAEAWREPEEARRLIAVYREAPTLLSFEDAAVCEMVEHSYDAYRLHTQLEAELMQVKKHRELNELERLDEVGKQTDQLYWRVVLHYWDDLKDIATERANNGQSLRHQALAELLMFYSPPREAVHVHPGMLDAYRRVVQALDEDAVKGVRKGK